jgi:hypothetical protein
VDSGYHPQLATLVKEPPRGDEWVHEIKFDGYRIGCRIRNGRVTLISRNGKDWTHAFPDIVDAATRLGVRDALIDGAVAMVLPDGRTSFQSLQHALTGDGGRAPLVYFVFDLLRPRRAPGIAAAEEPKRGSEARRPPEERPHPPPNMSRKRRSSHRLPPRPWDYFKRRDLPIARRHGGW